ncbi:hypothetical protein ACWGJT_03450 [Streptomyces xantholiticus]
MPTSELASLLEHSDTAGRSVIRDAAVSAGLMWKCRNPACGQHNLRAEGLCGNCGWDRQGRPLSDDQPGLYVAPDELWEQLREEIAEHLRREALEPLPDAVTFPWVSGSDTSPWSLTELVLHRGGTTMIHQTALGGTEIEETLDEIALAVEPSYLEALRIMLPR